ncbi:MAG: amidohydrolase [Candidatus Korobacteraceae bacterium]
MLSRRDLIKTAACAGAAAAVARLRPAFAVASQPSTAVNFNVPAGACDTHVHVFADTQKYPFAATRGYTPEPASVEELRALHKALHMDRVIVVQASVYGTDNSCTLDAIRQIGRGARGVAVIDETTPESVLDEMHRVGIRGLRINLAVMRSDPEMARNRFKLAAERAQRRKWHIQLNLPLALTEAVKDQISASPVPIVFDHFAGAQAAQGLDQPGFPVVMNLVRAGKAYIKISAAYSASKQPPAYTDAGVLAKALIAANPQRILWGTNWPHPYSSPPPGGKFTDVSPLQKVDDGNMLNQFGAWVTSAEQRKLILTDNPARLYEF